MKEDDTKKIRCSFCGSDEDTAEHLIEGPEIIIEEEYFACVFTPYICETCVDICVEAIAQQKRRGRSTDPARNQ